MQQDTCPSEDGLPYSYAWTAVTCCGFSACISHANVPFCPRNPILAPKYIATPTFFRICLPFGAVLLALSRDRIISRVSWLYAFLQTTSHRSSCANLKNAVCDCCIVQILLQKVHDNIPLSDVSRTFVISVATVSARFAWCRRTPTLVWGSFVTLHSLCSPADGLWPYALQHLCN